MNKGQDTAPPYEAAVQYIVDFHGMIGDTTIAQGLNEWGSRDSRGRKWTRQSVREVAESTTQSATVTKPTTERPNPLAQWAKDFEEYSAGNATSFIPRSGAK